MHSLGFVHRDLKPEHILVNKEDNTIKLIDFGCTIHITDAANQERREEYVGTFPYTPPEVS